jgi:hypothetical protein
VAVGLRRSGLPRILSALVLTANALTMFFWAGMEFMADEYNDITNNLN